MKLQIYAVYDKKAESFNSPVFFQNDALAQRGYQTVCRDKSTLFYSHPQDFQLYHVGDWDDREGLIRPIMPPRLVAELSKGLEDDEDKQP